MIQLAAIIVAILPGPPAAQVVEDRVEAIEINHYGHGWAGSPWRQVIFWRRVDAGLAGEGELVPWCVLFESQAPPAAAKPRRCLAANRRAKYVLEWTDTRCQWQGHATRRRVWCDHWVETHTARDPAAWHLWRAYQRRGLALGDLSPPAQQPPDTAPAWMP